MSELIVIEAEQIKSFKIISLEATEDPRLSWAAKGLHTYMISRPPNWKIYFNDLLNRSNCGRDKLRKLLSELEQFGYLEKEQLRDDSTSQFLGNVYKVYKSPLTEKPFTGSPSTGSPSPENPPLSNKESTNEKKKKKDYSNIDHSQANDRPHDQLPLFSISDFENKSAIEQDKMRQANLLHYLNASTSNKSDLPRAACGKVDKSSEAANASQKAFDLFWEQYPRKTAKAAALKAWAKLKASAELIDTIMHDIANRKQNDHQWRDPAFVPHPATYLNGQRWTDEVVKAPALTNQKTGVQSNKSEHEEALADIWASIRGEQ